MSFSADGPKAAIQPLDELIPSGHLPLVSKVLPQPHDLEGINGRTIPQPAVKGSDTSSISESNFREGRDSGYASLATTPDNGYPADSQRKLSVEVQLPSRRLFQRTITQLKVFDMPIPESTRNRFLDLKELFDRPLYDYLFKGKPRSSTISVKLKILGATEKDAKPWIVVFCDKAVSKRARQFFNQPAVKAQYQSRDDHACSSLFDLVVCDRPPILRAGRDHIGLYAPISTDTFRQITLCGTAIMASIDGENRFSTLGGIVEVTMPGHLSKLYGLTAGHFVSPKSLTEQADSENIVDDDDAGEYEDEDDYDCYFPRDEEEFELALEPEPQESLECLAAQGPTTSTVEWSSPPISEWSRIGNVSMPLYNSPDDALNLDWALIDIDGPLLYRPNLLVVADQQHGYSIHGELIELHDKQVDAPDGQPVMVLTGTGGVKEGRLLTSLSFLMLAPGKRLTEAYTLTLCEGSDINDGDCGSWVVDSVTLAVYGHVVASDVMNEVYVIPLRATIGQVKSTLQAEAVSLATSDYGRLLRERNARSPSGRETNSSLKEIDKSSGITGDQAESDVSVFNDQPVAAKHPSEAKAKLLPPSNASEHVANPLTEASPEPETSRFPNHPSRPTHHRDVSSVTSGYSLRDSSSPPTPVDWIHDLYSSELATAVPKNPAHHADANKSAEITLNRSKFKQRAQSKVKRFFTRGPQNQKQADAPALEQKGNCEPQPESTSELHDPSLAATYLSRALRDSGYSSMVSSPPSA